MSELHEIKASLFARNEGFGVDQIPFDLLVDESHTLEFDASDHPIENGAVITDHVTQRLRSCTVTGIFSNNVNNADPTNNKALNSYQQLKRIAQEKKPVRLVTALEVYPEMIILSMPVSRTNDDGESVKIKLTLREFKTAALKKTAIFGKYRPQSMTTESDRLVASTATNGKVSAKEIEISDTIMMGLGVNQ